MWHGYWWIRSAPLNSKRNIGSLTMVSTHSLYECKPLCSTKPFLDGPDAPDPSMQGRIQSKRTECWTICSMEACRILLFAISYALAIHKDGWSFAQASTWWCSSQLCRLSQPQGGVALKRAYVANHASNPSIFWAAVCVACNRRSNCDELMSMCPKASGLPNLLLWTRLACTWAWMA